MIIMSNSMVCVRALGPSCLLILVPGVKILLLERVSEGNKKLSPLQVYQGVRLLIWWTCKIVSVGILKGVVYQLLWQYVTRSILKENEFILPHSVSLNSRRMRMLGALHSQQERRERNACIAFTVFF